MKTSCELPLCMLDKNNELNDFDLVLFHLIKGNVTYRQWVYDQRRLHPERIMILDNSAYEFFIKGETLNLDEYVDLINDLQPDYYILPDVLGDRKKTIEGTKKFLKQYVIVPRDVFAPQPMAVIQGNDDKELTKCMFDYINMGIRCVCVPFHLEFFKNLKDEIRECIRDHYRHVYGEMAEIGCSDDLEYSMGRVQWMKDHLATLEIFQYIHFLGSHCPLEKYFFEKMDNYDVTMDTGYPVKLAVEGIELYEEKSKPNTIIDDFLEDDMDDETKRLIEKNVNIFKNT